MKTLQITVAGLILCLSHLAFAARPLRCTVVVLQPEPGSTELWIPPEMNVVTFDLKPNEEKTVYMKIVLAVPPPNLVQYTAEIAKNEADATLFATFSKTDDKNRSQKLPDGVYAVSFGEKGNPMWGIQEDAFADTVSTQLEQGKPTRGYVEMTCTSR